MGRLRDWSQNASSSRMGRRRPGVRQAEMTTPANWNEAAAGNATAAWEVLPEVQAVQEQRPPESPALEPRRGKQSAPPPGAPEQTAPMVNSGLLWLHRSSLSQCQDGTGRASAGDPGQLQVRFHRWWSRIFWDRSGPKLSSHWSGGGGSSGYRRGRSSHSLRLRDQG